MFYLFFSLQIGEFDYIIGTIREIMSSTNPPPYTIQDCTYFGGCSKLFHNEIDKDIKICLLISFNTAFALLVWP